MEYLGNSLQERICRVVRPGTSNCRHRPIFFGREPTYMRYMSNGINVIAIFVLFALFPLPCPLSPRYFFPSPRRYFLFGNAAVAFSCTLLATFAYRDTFHFHCIPPPPVRGFWISVQGYCSVPH